MAAGTRDSMLASIGDLWSRHKPTWNEMIEDIQNATGVQLDVSDDEEGDDEQVLDLFNTLTDEQVLCVLRYVQRATSPRTIHIDQFLDALGDLTAAAMLVEREWPGGNSFDDAFEGYPKYLPSFDEFVCDLQTWHETVRKAADRRRPS